MDSGKQIRSNIPARQNSLRLLPGVVIVILQWLIRFGVPNVSCWKLTGVSFAGNDKELKNLLPRLNLTTN